MEYEINQNWVLLSKFFWQIILLSPKDYKHKIHILWVVILPYTTKLYSKLKENKQKLVWSQNKSWPTLQNVKMNKQSLK